MTSADNVLHAEASLMTSADNVLHDEASLMTSADNVLHAEAILMTSADNVLHAEAILMTPNRLKRCSNVGSSAIKNIFLLFNKDHPDQTAHGSRLFLIFGISRSTVSRVLL